MSDMARPRLTVAITWSRFEHAVQAVLIESLRRLARYDNLPNGEEPLNLWLHWLAIKAHHAIANSAEGSLPFSVFFDGRSQPEPDDASGDARLLKRPDFTWLLFNQQAADPLRSELKYFTECKRLGSPEGGRNFNDLYSGEGILRFTTEEHAYAKGCRSASMIGYIQTMEPDNILVEVNSFAAGRTIPSLSRAALAWRAKEANHLTQDPLDRQFDAVKVRLTHFWIDLRGSMFDVPANQPPDSAAPDSPSPKPKQANNKEMAKKGRAKQPQKKKQPE
jgi:hypothetical protein